MMNAEKICDCLVVGAGLSGLTAARALSDAGRSPVVVDKGRGLGGRLATRRIQGIRMDHGAQFFTAEDAWFLEQVSAWREAGLLQEWSEDFPSEREVEPAMRGVKYRGSEGMTSIAKHLGDGLNIERSCRLTRVRWRDEFWEVETEVGTRLQAYSMILTPPVPQIMVLLETGRVELPEAWEAALAGVRYAPCLAALVLLDGPSRVPQSGGIWLKEPMKWMADNTLKGIQVEPVDPAGRAGVTIHSGAAFAVKHWDNDPAEVAKHMCGLVEPWLGSGVLERQLHRWLYAQVVKGIPSPCLALETPGPLILAGDAFGKGGVEGAVMSGWAAAEKILNMRGITGVGE
jgi:renalase